MDRHQRRRAGSVHRDARPAEVQGVGDPIGGYTQTGACGTVGRDVRQVAVAEPSIVAVADSYEHAGARAGQFIRRQTSVFQSLPGAFEQQPLLRIDLFGFASGNAEERGVELVHVFQEAAPARGRLFRGGWIGVVISVGRPAVRGNLRNGVHALLEQSPELLQVVRPRKPATDTNDGNRFHDLD